MHENEAVYFSNVNYQNSWAYYWQFYLTNSERIGM